MVFLKNNGKEVVSVKGVANGKILISDDGNQCKNAIESFRICVEEMKDFKENAEKAFVPAVTAFVKAVNELNCDYNK